MPALVSTHLFPRHNPLTPGERKLNRTVTTNVLLTTPLFLCRDLCSGDHAGCQSGAMFPGRRKIEFSSSQLLSLLSHPLFHLYSVKMS